MRSRSIEAMRRALVAAALLMCACAGDGDPSGVDVVEDGSIQGTVTDDLGVPVANATIALTGNEQSARSTASAADGVYAFADVPPGTYTLTITPPSGFTLGAAATTSVTVASEAESEAAAFVLERVIAPGSISGAVTDQNGAGVPNATVELTGNGQASRTVSTTPTGIYGFGSVPPGAYTLTVTPPPGFTIGSVTPTSVTVESGVQANASGFVVNRLPPDEFFAAVLHARLQVATATNEFSGAVLVMRDDSTLFEGAYGLANREQGIANTAATRFRVASMNKMLTAVAVLQLVQDGEVQLDVPLATYLPDYPNAELASKVTLHHLLTHTGGTGDIFGALFNQHRLELREIEDYLELYGTRDLLFEPGAQFSYSNYGFVLLGAVIERVTGMSYDDYVATHILAPAGMTATGAAPEDSVVAGRARGYMWQGGSLVSNASTLPYRGSPAGGWYSTVEDFDRFAVAIREHELLDATHTTLLLEGKVSVDGSPVLYAYGFMDRVLFQRRFVGHSGGDSGMSGQLTFEPHGGYTIVVLSNFDPPAAIMIEAFILGTLPSQ